MIGQGNLELEKFGKSQGKFMAVAMSNNIPRSSSPYKAVLSGFEYLPTQGCNLSSSLKDFC